MAVDVDPVNDLMPGFMSLADRADNGHLVARLAQRARLLPHAAIKRNGEILYDDKDTTRLFVTHKLVVLIVRHHWRNHGFSRASKMCLCSASQLPIHCLFVMYVGLHTDTSG